MGNRARADEEWVDIAYASKRTGFSSVMILRLIDDGDMPAMQIKRARRTTHRIPRRLVDEAHAKVMAGGKVELSTFARQWAARNSAPVTVEVA